MIRVVVYKDNEVEHDVTCSLLCMSYKDKGTVKAIVSGCSNSSVDDIPLLGCAASSAALKTVSSKQTKYGVENNDIHDVNRFSEGVGNNKVVNLIHPVS